MHSIRRVVLVNHSGQSEVSMQTIIIQTRHVHIHEHNYNNYYSADLAIRLL